MRRPNRVTTTVAQSEGVAASDPEFTTCFQQKAARHAPNIIARRKYVDSSTELRAGMSGSDLWVLASTRSASYGREARAWDLTDSE